MRGLQLPGLTFFGLLALMIVSLGPGIAAMHQAPPAAPALTAPAISVNGAGPTPASNDLDADAQLVVRRASAGLVMLPD